MSPGPIQLDQATALTLMLGPNGSVGIQASLLLRDILDRIRTESQDESEKGRWREQLFMRIALQQP